MPGGRPLKFKTVKEFEKKAEAYFKKTPFEEWTITGLALALDTSRETLMNYEKRGEFFDTIKTVKEMVENSYEIALKKKGRSGDIFALKNFGWKDKSEVETTHKGLNPILDAIDSRNKQKIK